MKENTLFVLIAGALAGLFGCVGNLFGSDEFVIAERGKPAACTIVYGRDAAPGGRFRRRGRLGGPARRARVARAGASAWKDPSRTDYHIRPGPHNITPVDWTAYMDFAARHGF